MDKTGFEVLTEYAGYVFLGWAKGWAAGKDNRRFAYYNMYVLSPVSSYVSEDYQAFGLKAEKKKCISADVWEGLVPGDRVKLFFDDKGRIIQSAIDG